MLHGRCHRGNQLVKTLTAMRQPQLVGCLHVHAPIARRVWRPAVAMCLQRWQLCVPCACLALLRVAVGDFAAYRGS